MFGGPLLRKTRKNQPVSGRMRSNTPTRVIWIRLRWVVNFTGTRLVLGRHRSKSWSDWSNPLWRPAPEALCKKIVKDFRDHRLGLCVPGPWFLVAKPGFLEKSLTARYQVINVYAFLRWCLTNVVVHADSSYPASSGVPWSACRNSLSLIPNSL